MTSAAALLVLSFVSASPIEVSTIDGRQHSGVLVSASDSTWKLDSNGETVELKLDTILEGRLAGEESLETAPPHSVVLLDGSRLGTESVDLAGETLSLKLSADSIKLPRTAISSIRLAESPSEVDDAWQELLERDRKEDWLVIRKQDRLDFVPGVVGNITSEHVSLLLDGDTVPVPRAKVFGVILRQRSQQTVRAAGVLRLASGDQLAVKSITSDGNSLDAVLAAGPTVAIPLSNIRLIDFSADKLTWLSSLKPRDVKHEFRFIDPAEPLKNDRDVWGDGLRLGNRSFSRGVCIRSKTVVQYRLDGDYSRFQSLMGIQFGFAGAVHTRIFVDGQEVFSKAVSPADGEPVSVDIDVAGKFMLEIQVDFGEDENDIGDHLVLADAKLLR